MHKLYVGHKKLLLIVLVFILVAGAAGAFWFGKEKLNLSKNDQKPYPEFASEAVYKLLKDAGDLYTKGKINEAIALIDQYLDSDTLTKWERSDALTTKAGYVLVRPKVKPKEARDDALSIYNQAIELIPEDPKPYEAVGKMYMNAGMKDEAKKWFEKALAAYDAGPPKERADKGREYYVSLVEGKSTDGLTQMYW